MTLALDTLKYAEQLEAAGVTPQVAYAHAHALAAVVDQQLATKTDIEVVKGEIQKAELRLEAKIAEVRSDLIRWTVGIVLGAGALQTAVIVALMLKLMH